MWRVLWLCVCWSAAPGRGEDAPFVVINQGRLRGSTLASRAGREFSAFLGIPYASPPVGPLRFLKALPAGSWEGERDATQPGSSCIQSNFTSLGLVFGSEDCLYLNVYTHKASNTSLSPVLVFIHGGGFVDGSGWLYQPDFLMDKDIVMVTLNYRLGAIGFLSMEDKELPGNNGLKDQTLALHWVQDNILQFGGNPESVTVSGEGAGAASVHLLMLSPLSKDLFHRGIAQSGSAYCPWASHASGQARAMAERLAANLGCNHFSTRDMLDCLRDMPAYVIVEVMHSLYEWHKDPSVLFSPAIEPEDVLDAFLTQDPWLLTSDKPWLAGVNSAEGAFKIKMFEDANIIELNEDFEMVAPVSLFFQHTAEDPIRTAFAVKKFYFLDGDINVNDFGALTNMYSDAWFVYPMMESFKRHQGPKYFYHFDYRGANSLVPELQGVSHFDDLLYFFPLQHCGLFNNFNDTVEDRRMSEKLIELWTNFVIYGKPTLDTSDVTWTAATTGTEYLHLKRGGFVMEKDLVKDRFNFWSSLPYREKYIDEDTVKDEL